MVVDYFSVATAFHRLIHLGIYIGKEREKKSKNKSKSALLITLITDNPLTLTKCLLFSVSSVQFSSVKHSPLMATAKPSIIMNVVVICDTFFSAGKFTRTPPMSSSS